MLKTRSMRLLMVGLVLALGLGLAVQAGMNGAVADERPGDGPPDFIRQAWERGEAPVIPENGPPAWVVEAWQNGEMPVAGPPPFIQVRLERAQALGLQGPPAEVVEAWESGNGENLPGPPAWVLDMLAE